MATRTERFEARLAPEEAEKIRQAAASSGMSASAFVVAAASRWADEVLHRERETVVSAEYFDRLLAWLDEPAEPIPALVRAAQEWDWQLSDDGETAIIRERTPSRRSRAR